MLEKLAVGIGRVQPLISSKFIMLWFPSPYVILTPLENGNNLSKMKVFSALLFFHHILSLWILPDSLFK